MSRPPSSSSSSGRRLVHAAAALLAFALTTLLLFLLMPSLVPSSLLNTTNTNLLSYIFTLVLNNPFSTSTTTTNYSSSSSSRSLSPDITRCGPVGLPPHAITSSNCCPPLLSSPIINITDFKDFATPTTKLRVRRPAHLVDHDFIAKFEKAVALMKALPEDDPRNFLQQAKVHCAYCNGAYPQTHPFQHLKIDIHRSWLFFPFHRWYIYFFERTLGHLIGDPSFALPYWNWDIPQGMQMPSFFANPNNSSLYHKLRHLNHTPPHLVDLYYGRPYDEHVPPDQQVSYNLAIMYKQVVLANTKELFMGSPYRLGDKAQPGIGTVELAPHNTLHTWTGAAHTPNHEDMGTFYTAARDPLFYPHHSNLDRMWHLWSNVVDGGSRRGYEDDPDWLDSEFFFYDEHLSLVRVKIRDCIDTKKLGYVYEEAELPWLSSPPPKPRRSRAQREEAKKAALLLLRSKPTVTKFPLLLDSKVSTIVKRPPPPPTTHQQKLRNKTEKEEEEVLVIEIVDLQSDKSVKFDVHVDDDGDGDKLSGADQTELVGTFVSVPHGHKVIKNTRYMVGISKVLKDLEAEEDDYVVVTLVPKDGKGMLRIGSIHIQFISK